MPELKLTGVEWMEPVAKLTGLEPVAKLTFPGGRELVLKLTGG